MSDTPTKVLIVDDEDGVIDMLSVALEAHGYEIESASNGEEGVNQAKAFRPDVILMDIMMPVMDGWEATKTLRANPEFDNTKIIVFTTTHQLKKAKEVGANQVVLKPFDIKQLVRAINAPSEPFKRS